MPELRPRRLINSGERGIFCLFLRRATRCRAAFSGSACAVDGMFNSALVSALNGGVSPIRNRRWTIWTGRWLYSNAQIAVTAAEILAEFNLSTMLGSNAAHDACRTLERGANGLSCPDYTGRHAMS